VRRASALTARIVSGGQTGVDRAALDVALALRVPCGGWCPKGRTAEDGLIAVRYPLKETPSEEYAQRTEWNVRDSDGTLILNRGLLSGGTAQIIALATRVKKPWFVVDLTDPPSGVEVRAWMAAHRITVLNVAGPRESKCPGVYAQATRFLQSLLSISSAPPTRKE